ncbi:MAG: methylglutamate dehydrogenase subunit, partial [Gammaproteobacteria bacterium]|nr:methylglutamate dehydrogenase subunit [Gammaproteobacteria bacterium]
RKDAATALARHLQAHFNCALPTSPRRTCGNDIAVMGIGPGSWLAMRENGGNDFASSLKPILGPFAAISDQSDAYGVFRLTGPNLRAALSKLVPIDIHDRAFKVGDVAETIAGHIGLLFWRLDDTAGSPVFDIAVARSFSVSLRHTLIQSAAEFELAWEES